MWQSCQRWKCEIGEMEHSVVAEKLWTALSVGVAQLVPPSRNFQRNYVRQPCTYFHRKVRILDIFKVRRLLKWMGGLKPCVYSLRGLISDVLVYVKRDNRKMCVRPKWREFHTILQSDSTLRNQLWPLSGTHVSNISVVVYSDRPHKMICGLHCTIEQR
jgi:hypothetical protein